MSHPVDGLLFNLLGAGECVQLPGVGSLRPGVRPACRLSERGILRAARVVAFGEEPCGRPLTEWIAESAECTSDEAESIYARWLEQARKQDGGLHIEGVGVLESGRFVPYEAFDRLLNPLGSERLLWGRSRFARVAPVALLLLLLFGFGYFVVAEFLGAPPEESDPLAAQIALTQSPNAPAASLFDPYVPDTRQLPDDLMDDLPEAAVESAGGESATHREPDGEPAAGDLREDRQPVRASDAAPTESAPQRPSTDAPQRHAPMPRPMVSGRTYVVYGVFSTVENARRAVAMVAATDSALAPAIYPFGEKYLVALSDFASQDEATAFIRQWRGVWRDLWGYSKR